MSTFDRIPVILDTDIGGDIDDTWALVMMLNSPELDVKLVVSDTGDTVYRSKILAKMLQIAGRTDIPVGVGIPFESRRKYRQGPWVEDYDLADYSGKVLEDGVGAIIDVVMNAPEPVTLICIGPVPNIAEVLRREPHVAERARFVGMHGSIRRGYAGRAEPNAECNVVNHVRDCQAVFSASWEMTITPLDTCGLVRLRGEKYAAVRDAPSPLAHALMENYRIWARSAKGAPDPRVESSVLFDTVAIYLAFADDLLLMERLGIRVTDDGYTVIDGGAKPIRCATQWRDLAAFEDLLVQRIVK